MKTIPIAAIIFLMSVRLCGAEGLGTLIEVAKSQSDIKSQYDEETRNFKKVMNGIESKAIIKGQSISDIQSKYGEPVVSVKDPDGKRTDCIYKPETSSFFEGIRATLIYTEQGVLDEARIEEVR